MGLLNWYTNAVLESKGEFCVNNKHFCRLPKHLENTGWNLCNTIDIFPSIVMRQKFRRTMLPEYQSVKGNPANPGRHLCLHCIRYLSILHIRGFGYELKADKCVSL